VIITSVERQPRRRRANVFVDGEFVMAVGLEVAAERDVRPGRSISQDELSSLAEADERRTAVDAALRLISYRPRSERELRQRLARKGIRPAVREETLGRLREMGYLDDAAFARFWVETKQAASPRSKRLLAVELRQKGIERETAEEATGELSDEDAAYEAATRRLRSLGGLAYGAFRERLGAFLTRRGFAYEVARKTVDRCWAELEEGQGSGVMGQGMADG